jgi:hypothetical protein
VLFYVSAHRWLLIGYTNSAEFKQGVEAELNAEKDMKNWKAGNELGLELKEEVEDDEPVSKSPLKESSVVPCR